MREGSEMHTHLLKLVEIHGGEAEMLERFTEDREGSEMHTLNLLKLVEIHGGEAERLERFTEDEGRLRDAHPPA